MPTAESKSGKKVLVIEVYSDEYEVEVVNHGREMNADDAKEVIGWKIEAEGEKEFDKNEIALRDIEGNNVKLEKNLTNRPYSKKDAARYAHIMKNGDWVLNGETMIVDDKGYLSSAQHRIIGLVLANQAKTGKAKKVTIPAIVVKGVSSKKEVADTPDTGRVRTLNDVVFRNREFGKKLSPKDLKGLAKDYAVATRLVWLRINGGLVSGGGKFEHVEAVALQKKHPLLKQCVEYIFEENGGNSKEEGRKISQYISLGYAGALMYLMATSKSKDEISTTQQGKAEKFWTLLASGASSGNDLWSALRKKLLSIDASGAKGRDEICGVVVKAWEIYQAGKADEACTPKDLALKVKKDDGKFKFAETPRFGGLDLEVEQPEPEVEAEPEAKEEKVEEAPKAAPKAKGKGKKKAAAKSEGGVSEEPADSAAAPQVS